MSVVSDNKSFVSTVLGVASPDFDKATFGIWVTFFQNVNYSDTAYTLPQPLVEDIVASEYAVTGKRFSIVTSDGKKPKARFFITSGIKGLNGYDYLEPLAEITNTYISGYKPEILMPDMDFAGKIFRRTEVLSTSRSPVSNNNVLAIQAEDWQQTSINVNATNTDNPFSYVDTGYTDYSNESTTRYKFLYDDSGNSIKNDFSIFELPIQVENGAAYKYRISRKSEPLGQSYFAELTSDGKGIIDYSQYKNEMSGNIDGKISYDFENITNIALGKNEFSEFSDKVNLIKSIKNDTNLTDLKISRAIDAEANEIYNFYLLSNNQSFNDIYRIGVSFDKYKVNSKEGITGYVMSSYNMGDGSSTKTIALSQGGLVYPRVSENGNVYKSENVSDLVDIQEVFESETFAQDPDKQEKAATAVADNIGKTMANYFDALSNALNDKYGEEEGGLSDDGENIINQKESIETKDFENLLIANSSIPKNESALPNFQLPKKIITSDFYSNYLNSGEKYVALPLSRYSNNYCYLAYGNSYGVLGYGISPGVREVYNSTCNGVYIDEVSFCKGDTATERFNAPLDDGIYYRNGLVTEIPSNGIIVKENYEKLLSWQNAVNYYYVKNYVHSFDVYPNYSQVEYSNLFTQALTQVKETIGGPTFKSNSQNSFLNNGASQPRIFVEREIYTEEYNADQEEQFNQFLFSDINIADNEDLSSKPKEKLYCVETYDLSNFARNKQTFFYPIQNYDETLTFNSIVTNSSIQYTKIDDNDIGVVSFSNAEINAKNIFRTEYITGSASTFSYQNYSNASVWTGVNGSTININNQDDKNYGYHLYTYSANSDPLVLVKSNVKTNDIANVSSSKAVVLKFTKQRFNSKIGKGKTIDSEGKESAYFYLFLSVLDSNNVFYDVGKTKVNVQIYDYDAVSPEAIHQWYVFNKNPINDSFYGKDTDLQQNKPRFFEDASEANKAIAEQLFLFPNGPCTSKNYEGSPIGIESINGLADGLFANNIKIQEGDENTFIYKSNACLDFEEDGKVIKQKSLAQRTNSIVFNTVKRLKITKVKYNFYTKDLVLIGDAGFTNSTQFNYGWEFKLQYRIKNSNSSWKTLEENGSFNASEISVQSSQISPFYTLLSEGNNLNCLQMMAFKTNLPLYLDDDNYEFKIAKYEKLHVFSSDVDIVKKVNFLPIKVQWTADPDCQYYNIYQKDSGNNLLLISTENVNQNISYGIPDVKQSYIDLGPTSFGSPNYSGYYDVVVSGIIPSVKENSNSISSEYGFEIGNSNDQFSIKKITNQPNSVFAKAINNPTYTPLINFNNPESKISDFTINPNYDGYYFISNSANAQFSDLLDKTFEGYVANTGTSSCSVFSQTVPSNNVASISNNGSISVSALKSLPALTLDINDVEDGQDLYLTNSLTISNSHAVSSRILEITNDSSSIINITYNSVSYSIAANKTSKFTFSTSSASIDPIIKDNIYFQDDSVYYPSTGFVNINHSLATLDPSKTSSSFPVYNFSNSKLSINGSLDLAADSFSILNWNGSSVTSVSKDSFDGIKIFILGNEPDTERTILLKDDTEINVSNFNILNSSEEYFFLKDELVTRNLSISIINGSNKYVLPAQNQDFKLTVSKIGSTINYKLLYPSSSPFFNITEDLEQLILLVGSDTQSIDLNYLESAIPKGAFIYIINKGQSDLNFYKGDSTQAVYTVSPNQIARASIITTANANGIKVDIIKSAYSHFSFNIDPALHLTNSINILDLNFCGTSINFPSASNFASKNTFLLCRNRAVPNKTDDQFVSYEAGLINTEDDPSTAEISEKGQFAANSIALSVYRKNSLDSIPTLERTSFIQNGFLGNETSPSNDVTAFFYIKENDLNNFSIRDFYNRKTFYSGKVFLPSTRDIRINSFDDNHFYRIKSNSISFDYDPDKYTNGRLSAKDEKDAVIISRDSEKAEVTKSFPNALADNQILINFAYDAVTVSVSSVSKTIKKNRLIKNDTADSIYPVYNREEFFIAASSERSANTTTLYYEIIGKEMDVKSIILPDSSAVITYVIKNSSSRIYPIYTLAGTLVYNLEPNNQKEFVFNGVSYNANNNSTPYSTSLNILSIKTENQDQEIDLEHPLSYLWTSFSIDSIKNSFIGNGTDTEIELKSNNSVYTYQLFDVLTTVPSSSDKIIYCYGRKSGELDIGDSKYLVNGFYLFLYYKDTIIKENEFYTTGDKFNSAGTYPLSVIEYKHIDLLKYMQTYSSVVSLPDVVLLPFASQLSQYYLPNLDTIYNDGPQDYALRSLLANKKFIFVNMAKCSKDAQNKVTNYNGNATEELSDINSLVMYEISSGEWIKSTSGVPIVKPVYPTLTSVKGLSTTQTSEIAGGDEFVYLPNFSRFNITKDSFTDKELKNFYLFNSASTRIFINSNQSMLSSDKFVKIYRNQQSESFSSQSLQIGGSSPFVSIQLTKTAEETDTVIERDYSNLKLGTYLKVTELVGTGIDLKKYTLFYSYDSSGKPSRITIKNQFFADLDLFSLKNYAPNSKLFIYGVSGITEAGLSFDSYNLRLLNSDTLNGEKFYIYNNCNSVFKVFFKDSDSDTSQDFVVVPPRRLLEVSDKASFMETHEKGRFYINPRKQNKVYINKSDLPAFIDGLSDYQSLTSSIESIAMVDDINCFILSATKYKNSAVFYYYQNMQSDNSTLSLDSNSLLKLQTAQSFLLNPINLKTIAKPNYITPSGGHYIFNNSNYVIKIDSSVLSEKLFLVNNCAGNIQIGLTVSSKLNNITLYRNTVLVIDTDGSTRYLKKAKRKDEFYCVFNPKTAIATQSEISFAKGIKRNEDVLPILDDNGVRHQSYIKFLSRYGSSYTTYLSIKDYYNGIDVPTDLPEGIVAYEAGLGHETICKFLFFDPSKSTYTLPGIVAGNKYRVDIDYSLFLNISQLQGIDETTSEENPYVIYKGKKYFHNDVFEGSYVSTYEVKYPNYVRVFKTTQDQQEDTKLIEKQNEDIDESITEQITEPIDKNAIFYQTINESINSAFGSLLSWIPKEEEAFWMTSNTSKDIWQIDTVYAGSTKQFSYDDRQVTFTKCSLKKTDLRSLIFSNRFQFYSALQERSVTKMNNGSTPPDDLILLGDAISDVELRNKISNAIRNKNNLEDYIVPKKEIFLSSIYKSSIFPDQSAQLKETDFEINISIDKIKNLPSIVFQDFSKSQTIKILNNNL